MLAVLQKRTDSSDGGRRTKLAVSAGGTPISGDATPHVRAPPASRAKSIRDFAMDSISLPVVLILYRDPYDTGAWDQDAPPSVIVEKYRDLIESGLVNIPMLAAVLPTSESPLAFSLEATGVITQEANVLVFRCAKDSPLNNRTVKLPRQYEELNRKILAWSTVHDPVTDILTVYMTSKNWRGLSIRNNIPAVDITRISFLNQGSVKKPGLVGIWVMALVNTHAMTTNAVLRHAMAITHPEDVYDNDSLRQSTTSKGASGSIAPVPAIASTHAITAAQDTASAPEVQHSFAPSGISGFIPTAKSAVSARRDKVGKSPVKPRKSGVRKVTNRFWMWYPEHRPLRIIPFLEFLRGSSAGLAAAEDICSLASFHEMLPYQSGWYTVYILVSEARKSVETSTVDIIYDSGTVNVHDQKGNIIKASATFSFADLHTTKLQESTSHNCVLSLCEKAASQTILTSRHQMFASSSARNASGALRDYRRYYLQTELPESIGADEAHGPRSWGAFGRFRTKRAIIITNNDPNHTPLRYGPVRTGSVTKDIMKQRDTDTRNITKVRVYTNKMGAVPVVLNALTEDCVRTEKALIDVVCLLGTFVPDISDSALNNELVNSIRSTSIGPPLVKTGISDEDMPDRIIPDVEDDAEDKFISNTQEASEHDDDFDYDNNAEEVDNDEDEDNSDFMLSASPPRPTQTMQATQDDEITPVPASGTRAAASAARGVRAKSEKPSANEEEQREITPAPKSVTTKQSRAPLKKRLEAPENLHRSGTLAPPSTPPRGTRNKRLKSAGRGFKRNKKN